MFHACKMCYGICYEIYGPVVVEKAPGTDIRFSISKDESMHKVAKELYGDEKDSDWRFKYQLEEMYYGYYYRTLKYYKQTESTTVGITNNQTIPMIRMSEVYYIAAEAIFDTNPQEAQGYLELVKKGRGVSKKFDNVTNKSEFINLLVNDARREFLGEGQIFYMYKRLNRTMPASSYYSNPVLPTDENMILPKPDSESNI